MRNERKKFHTVHKLPYHLPSHYHANPDVSIQYPLNLAVLLRLQVFESSEGNDAML
jgi:hypothetical protein